MQREELETELAKIGWRIRQSNGLNDHIINHYGEQTGFVVCGANLEVRTNLFGGDTSMGRGNCYFNLESIKVTSGGDNGKTEWVALNFGEKNYIQLYNHDKEKETEA